MTGMQYGPVRQSGPLWAHGATAHTAGPVGKGNGKTA